MIFDKYGTTTIVSKENSSLTKFLASFKEEYPKLINDNIVINLFSFGKLAADDILEFLELSDKHKKNKKSLVLVSENISYGEVPDGIIIVPTIQEAHDFIELEEIERDLDI